MCDKFPFDEDAEVPTKVVRVHVVQVIQVVQVGQVVQHAHIS